MSDGFKLISLLPSSIFTTLPQDNAKTIFFMVLYLILSLILTPRYNFILFNNMDLIEPTFEQPLSAQYEVQPKPEIKKPISDLKDSVKTIKKGKPSPPSNNISSHPLTISLLNQSLSNYFP